MKNIFITIVVVFTFFKVNSQSYKGEIHYKKELITSENNADKKEVNDYLSKKNENLQRLLTDIDFLLKFNNNESFFYSKCLNFQVEEDRYYRLAKMSGGRSGDWYVNSMTKERLRKVDAFGQEFIVKSSIEKNEWHLLNESKRIGNYLCYKATAIYIVKNSKGTFNHPVEVWYTPELPIAFGPLGYGGLPGLIVELTVRNVKYTISKIMLNPEKKIEIKKPTKGKLVTEEEFNAIGEEAMGNFRSKISN